MDITFTQEHRKKHILLPIAVVLLLATAIVIWYFFPFRKSFWADTSVER